MKAHSTTDTIYDVGMNNGDDTAYYLHLGYRVIAIEADPQLAGAAGVRFSDAVGSGQLTVLNVGIAEQAGKATFWVSQDHSVLSSFRNDLAMREGGRSYPVEVETTRFGDVLKEFGVPHYLKIDIEGADHLCVRDLDASSLPRFISMETECWADGQLLTEEDGLANLKLLRSAGYRLFKLVDQTNFRSLRYGSDALMERVIRSAAYGRLALPGLSRLARRFTHEDRLRRSPYQFSYGSSGPWGNSVQGRWISFAAAEELYRVARRRIPAAWFDWHATV